MNQITSPTDPITIGQADSTASSTDQPVAEDLHIRNYDALRRYTVTITALDDGTPIFRHRFDLDPGERVSEQNVLEPGTYRVQATLDSGNDARETVTISAEPTDNALVECGNGVVNITEGYL